VTASGSGGIWRRPAIGERADLRLTFVLPTWALAVGNPRHAIMWDVFPEGEWLHFLVLHFLFLTRMTGAGFIFDF
jgi:hypothetical protein